jgi:hypothetical protein
MYERLLRIPARGVCGVLNGPPPALRPKDAVTTFAGMCLLFALGGQQTFADQIDKALPPPTGKNGYEEYCQAAKEVFTPAFGTYEYLYIDSSGMTSSAGDDALDPATIALRTRLKGMTFLAVKREEAEKFEHPLQLVRAGSLKPVYDPRTSLSPGTTFPELATFRSLTRLFVSESYVKFADGDSSAGTKSLMDGLAFNYHISGGSVIASLVGVAGSSIVFRAFESRLPSLSVKDCRDIQTISTQILAAPMGLKAGLEMERKLNMSTIANAFKSLANLKDFEKGFSSDEDQKDDGPTKAIDAQLKNAQPADFARWAQEAPNAVSDLYLGLESKLDLPDAKWFGAEDDTSLLKSQHSPIVAAIVGAISPSWDGLLAAVARQRTQLRLLALHGMILEYKWENNKLPAKLSDAVAAASCQDPLSGQSFVYERKADGYRLYSRGIKATGQIELNYRRPTDAAAVGGPP